MHFSTRLLKKTAEFSFSNKFVLFLACLVIAITMICNSIGLRNSLPDFKSFFDQHAIVGQYLGYGDEYALQLYMHNQRVHIFNKSSMIHLDEYRMNQYIQNHQVLLANESAILHDDLDPTNHPKGLLYNMFGNNEVDIIHGHDNYSQHNHDIFSNTNGDLVYSSSLCWAIKLFQQSNKTKKHVLLAHINANWGAFSSPVPNRTVNWGEWSSHWKNAGCDMDDLWSYLNHSNLLAIFTTTHQNSIQPHPKVFSIPIGVACPVHDYDKLHNTTFVNRTKLLMINNQVSEDRSPIIASVMKNFNGHNISNTYGLKDGYDYYQELHESKFILCPSGMGWDTYRSWEALVMGAIPILERYYRQDGFYKVYDDLPVLWVDHYDNVTPSLLKDAYPRILEKAHEYKFEKLTQKWWADLINSHRTNHATNE